MSLSASGKTKNGKSRLSSLMSAKLAQRELDIKVDVKRCLVFGLPAYARDLAFYTVVYSKYDLRIQHCATYNDDDLQFELEV